MSLFAEIAREGDRSRPGADLREEVRAHLLRLCQVRRGSLLLAPEYGSDEPTHLFHSFPGGLDEWQARLETAIRRYEPRLRSARVVPKVNESLDLTLRFAIHGILAGDATQTPVQFHATVDAARGWTLG